MTTTHTQPAGYDLDSLEALVAAVENACTSPAEEDAYNELHRALTARTVRALIAAARAAQAPQGDTRQGAPIYQVQFFYEQGSSAWHDASEAAYHVTMTERRRIVYASRAVHTCTPQGELAPTETSQWLREYADTPGYSHNDYADTMRMAADEIDRLTRLATPAAYTCTPADERDTYTVDGEVMSPLEYIAHLHGQVARLTVDLGAAQIRINKYERVVVASVESLQARAAQGAGTAPAESKQPIIGRLMDEISNLQMLWGLNEPGALLRNSDVFKVLVAVGKEYSSSTTHPVPVSTAAATTASAHPGCGHCNNPLFAGTRCDCGKVFSRAADGQQGTASAIADANGLTAAELADLVKPGHLEDHVYSLAARVAAMSIRKSEPDEALMFQIKRLQSVLPEAHRNHIARAVNWHEAGRPTLDVRPLIPSTIQADGQHGTAAATTASASGWQARRYCKGDGECATCGGSQSASDPKGWQFERVPCPNCAPADGQQGASRAALDDSLRRQIIADTNATLQEQAATMLAQQEKIQQLEAALARAPLPAQADGQAVDDARFDSHILLWLCDEAWFQDEIGHRLDLPGTDETVEETVRDLRKLFARMFRDSAAQSRAQSDTTGENHG